MLGLVRTPQSLSFLFPSRFTFRSLHVFCSFSSIYVYVLECLPKEYLYVCCLPMLPSILLGAFHKCSHKSGFSWARIDFNFFNFCRCLHPAFFPAFSLFHFLSLDFSSRIPYRISLACCLLACLLLAFKNVLNISWPLIRSLGF